MPSQQTVLFGKKVAELKLTEQLSSTVHSAKISLYFYIGWHRKNKNIVHVLLKKCMKYILLRYVVVVL
jgi:hypothetical protein